jgi:hypothetical protein
LARRGPEAGVATGRVQVRPDRGGCGIAVIAVRSLRHRAPSAGSPCRSC